MLPMLIMRPTSVIWAAAAARASRDLRLPTPAPSPRVGMLAAELGVRLLHGATRRVSLTHGT